MDLSRWFEYQLRSTLDGFLWAVGQLPGERFYVPPPTTLGEWCAAQHIYHMLEYEKNLAFPSMHQWLGARPPVRKEDHEKEIQNPPPMEGILTEFEQVRQAEIALLSRFDDDQWNSIQNTTFWGEVSLSWLVCKTYQHALDHTHDILRLVLFWDRILRRMAQSKP